MNVCFGLPPQPVEATHALNLSAGVSKPNFELAPSSKNGFSDHRFETQKYGPAIFQLIMVNTQAFLIP